jgi:hypothetical protein
MSLNDDVDGWVAQLMQCKPLSEGEVKKLCEKVSRGSLYVKDGKQWVYGGELGMTFELKDKGVE